MNVSHTTGTGLTSKRSVQEPYITGCLCFRNTAQLNVQSIAKSLKKVFSRRNTNAPPAVLAHAVNIVTQIDPKDVDLGLDKREDEEDDLNTIPSYFVAEQKSYQFDHFWTKPAKSFAASYFPRQSVEICSEVQCINTDIDWSSQGDDRHPLVRMGKLLVHTTTYSAAVLIQRGQRSIQRLSLLQILKMLLFHNSTYDAERDDHYSRWSRKITTDADLVSWFAKTTEERVIDILKHPVCIS